MVRRNPVTNPSSRNRIMTTSATPIVVMSELVHRTRMLRTLYLRGIIGSYDLADPGGRRDSQYTPDRHDAAEQSSCDGDDQCGCGAQRMHPKCAGAAERFDDYARAENPQRYTRAEEAAEEPNRGAFAEQHRGDRGAAESDRAHYRDFVDPLADHHRRRIGCNQQHRQDYQRAQREHDAAQVTERGKAGG